MTGKQTTAQMYGLAKDATHPHSRLTMEEADLLKERFQAITDKRKIQEDIAKKRRDIEEEKLKLQYLKACRTSTGAHSVGCRVISRGPPFTDVLPLIPEHLPVVGQ
ncbi:hypothetical protein SKAU_G00066890 [Synaphobranchus kaupii]|uniref:Uncharacterized protein n=1 Tax=Synaphobranchus kaupii TaxID=118154 RepID=A0A9Q1J953_SYNKA|nr:hypothetical protein SKAU_G00066890 [Synaphobranchus kaupii]